MIFFLFKEKVSVISGSLSPRHGASSGCWWRKGLQIFIVAANILNKQSKTADKGWSSSLALGEKPCKHLVFRQDALQAMTLPLLRFDYPNNTWREIEIIKLLVMESTLSDDALTVRISQKRSPCVVILLCITDVNKYIQSRRWKNVAFVCASGTFLPHCLANPKS
jgi:hypothetical protein